MPEIYNAALRLPDYYAQYIEWKLVVDHDFSMLTDKNMRDINVIQTN